EDPERGFLPSTGRLVHLTPPHPSAHVRIDTGVEEGDSITPFYDPMIAKLIVHDSDRAAALARMRAALAGYRIVGVASNVEFLGRLVATRSFATADLDTSLIEREHAALFPPGAEPDDDVWLVAALAELARDGAARRHQALADAEQGSPWALHDGWRLNGRASRRLAFRFAESTRHVDATVLAQGGWQLVSGTSTLVATAELHGASGVTATLGGRRLAATVVAQGDRRHVFVGGHVVVLSLLDPLAGERADADEEGAGLLAPMPGKVIALLAEPGAAVDKGTPLLVLEAMKMEHTISAPHAGTLKAYRFAPGDQVDEGAELVEFE
ncbi:MAG: 3-methylcrotonyl-CoA carboxylase, partial [Pseudomonadota bacterium]|nr:3-methylcrotonyl-CoA carboxylase [Pseudomonadota bacterium]